MYKSYLPKKDDDSATNESYQKLVKDNNYTAADIARLRTRAKRYCIVYITLAIALLGYVIYLFTQGAIFAGVCTIPLSLLPLASAFKENFFIFCLDKKSFKQNFASWSQQLINRDEEI